MSAEDSATMPMSAVSVVMNRSSIVPSSINSTGDRTNMYGMMKAAMASFDALMPVLRGLPPAMPDPAKAARATGGVTSAMMPK